jgi:hypothetical protein
MWALSFVLFVVIVFNVYLGSIIMQMKKDIAKLRRNSNNNNDVEKTTKTKRKLYAKDAKDILNKFVPASKNKEEEEDSSSSSSSEEDDEFED